MFGAVTLLGAGITAFYMSRLFFMTFEGERRWSTKRDGSAQHPHESPKLMTWPMIVLAVGSIGLGFFLNLGGRFVEWLSPVLGHAEHGEPVLPIWVIMILTLALVVVGVVIAWRRYAVSQVPVIPPVGTVLTRAARVDLYQDTVNDVLLVEPGQALTRSLVYADRTVVDGTVTGVGLSTVVLGRLGAAPADRVRPVVRRDDAARPRRPRRRRPGHPELRSAPTDVVLLPLADRPDRRAPPGCGGAVGAPCQPCPSRRARRLPARAACSASPP